MAAPGACLIPDPSMKVKHLPPTRMRAEGQVPVYSAEIQFKSAGCPEHRCASPMGEDELRRTGTTGQSQGKPTGLCSVS